MNWVVLGEGGGGPRDSVALMLSGAWTEVESGPLEKGADDCLLERGDDAGVDGSIHESIFNGIEALGEDIVVTCATVISVWFVCLVGEERRWANSALTCLWISWSRRQSRWTLARTPRSPRPSRRGSTR